MLVVVHDGDIAFLFETALYLKAFGRFDVLEVYAAEGGCYGFYYLYEFFGIFLVDFDVKAVDAGEYLEEERFAFHNRFSCKGTDITETEHCGTVGDDGNEISFVGVFVGVLRMLFDFQTRECHAGRVGQGEVVLR